MKREILSERSELFEPDARIHFLFELNGKPDDDKLMNAVKKAYHMNETTMSRIQLNADGSAEYIRIDECKNTVEVTDRDYMEIIQSEQKKPLDIWNGEMMKVFILPRRENTQLLVMANHLAGDGMSMVYFAEDVMQVLNADENQVFAFKPAKLLTADTYPLNGRMKMKYKLFLALYNQKWRKKGKIFTVEDYKKLYQTYWTTNPSEIRLYTFTPKEEALLVQKAKEYSVSVSSLLGAVFAMTMEQEALLRENKCEIGFAVNIREKGDYSLTNKVAGTRVNIDFNKKPDMKQCVDLFQETLHIKNEIEMNRNFVLRFVSRVSPSLYDSIFFIKYGLLQNPISKEFTVVSGYDDTTMREMGITNLTKLHFESKDREFFIKNCIFIPPAVSYAACILGVVTTDAGMNLVFRFRNNPDAADRERLWEKGIAALKKLMINC